MSEEEKSYFIRGKDGILRRNPALPRYQTRGYTDPGEAIMVNSRGESRLGCNERMFRDWSSYPCGNKPKYDPDVNGNLTKCGHHSAEAKKRKKEKADAKYQEYTAKIERRSQIGRIKDEMLPLIRSIAEWHNDPHTACQEWLDRYNAIT